MASMPGEQRHDRSIVLDTGWTMDQVYDGGIVGNICNCVRYGSCEAVWLGGTKYPDEIRQWNESNEERSDFVRFAYVESFMC
jgi:hypothetical protein